MTLPQIFAPNGRHRYCDRAARALPADHWIVNRMANELLARLDPVRRSFDNVLILGNDFGAHWARLSAGGAVITRAGPGRWHEGVTCEEDFLPFAPGSFDLILSLGTLDTVNDLPGALVQIRRCLAPDGMFLGAMMGAGSLTRLKSIIAAVEPGVARTHPQIDVRAAGDLLARAGFALPVADADAVTVRYSSFMRLVSDLRANALTNALVSRRPLTRAALGQIAARFDASNRQEIFGIIHLTGWAPAAK